MANAKPSGKLTTGAIGNFLLGGAAALFALTIGAAMFGGAAPSATGAGILGLLVFVFIIGGGICASLGWFGLGSLHGGTNSLAGIFSILLAVAPLLIIVLAVNAVETAAHSQSLAAAESSGQAMGTIGLVLGTGVPGFLGIFGGLGVTRARSSLAKPSGLLLILGGAGCLTLTVMGFAGIGSPTLGSIAFYAGFFGLAVGFFLTGATMLGEKNA